MNSGCEEFHGTEASATGKPSLRRIRIRSVILFSFYRLRWYTGKQLCKSGNLCNHFFTCSLRLILYPKCLFINLHTAFHRSLILCVVVSSFAAGERFITLLAVRLLFYHSELYAIAIYCFL